MVLCDFRWIVEHPCQTQWVFRAQVGMTVVVDHSGKLHGKQKCSIKDVISNKEAVCLPKQKWQETYFLGPFGYVGKSSVIQVFHQKKLLQSIYVICWRNWYTKTSLQVVLAVVKGLNGRTRASAYVLQRAILEYYSSSKLFPSGVVAELPAVQTWSLKHGLALKKLDTHLWS